VVPKDQYDMMIPDLFRSAAKQYPTLPALDGPKFSLTYAELDAVTDSLAAFLRTKYRAAPETVVGIYMERCEEYVIALLSIWKAGAAYCPIEVAYPPPLLRSVFDEVEPKVVLTKEAYAANVPRSISKFSFDGDWRGVISHMSSDVKVLEENKANPESLGYVVMSGGTTGKPKGIEAPMRSPVASYLWRYSISGYGPGARVGCNVFFVWEIIRPLLRGGTTVVIPDDIIFDSHKLAPYLESKAITEVLFTPSLFETLLNTCDAEFLRSLPLQVVWLNGEVVTTKLLQQAGRHLPDVLFCSTYSISECGEVCGVRLDAERPDCPDFCPVGRVADFAEYRVMNTERLSSHDEPEEVAKGEPGELWVSGRGVGRGYTKNPTKTKEVFITYEGKPFYRTGDLVRELHDGAIEVLGRCDFMAKVRGYSVVLGAVESSVFKLLGVNQAIVVAAGAEGTDKRLVAYMSPCIPGELRGRLALDQALIDEHGRSPLLFQELVKELPHYAVPSVYVVMDSLPIDPVSTKASRKALPPPPAPPPAAAIPASFQFDGSEAACQLIFEEVLGLPAGTLTGESNFFEFGGHSLLVTQLLARITELGGPRVSVADFLRAPTAAGAARLISGEGVAAGPVRFLPQEVEKHTHAMPDIGLSVQAYWRYTVFANNSQRVLLTGATGYLGVHLLAQLLKKTSCQVFCIVRPPAGSEDRPAAARQRLVEHLQAQSFMDLDLDRLQVIPGDVSSPHMGMDEGEHLFLQQLIDVVVHAAANVNLAYTYDLLEAANVQGTARAIEFARGGKVKALHFISTNGIFPESGTPGSFSEADTPPHHLLDTGYGQTKWVAEQLVLKANELGLPCVVYRLGNLAGPLHGSGWNENDSNLLFLRACIERGAVPEAGDWSLELTPVDFVAEFVQNCMMDLKFANSKTFHLINEQKLSLQVMAQVAARVGFPIARKDKSAWCENKGKQQEGLLSIVLGQDALHSLLGRHHQCSQENTMAACDHFGMSYPALTDASFGAYLRRLVSERLLPSPMSLPGRLGGRVALVTGASSGIGRAVARVLAGEGATVVIVARSEQKLKEVSASLPGESVPMPCDVTSRKAVHDMIGKVEARLGQIDIVVNCAGVMFFTLMKNLHYEEWEQTIEVNCKGVVNVCGATLPAMMKAGSGHFVNISSDAAKTLFPALTVYNASKAFVNTFSRGLRAECVGSGIRVTDIQPGDTATNLIMQNTDQEAADKVGVKIGDVVCAGAPREFYLDPEDVAASVLYAVCSPTHVGVHEMVIEPRDQMYGDPTAMSS
jgi:thioester reductase-like protein